MKYKITLNNRVYEVEVEEGKAMLRQWGIPDHFEGVGNCILGYRAEGGVKEVAPRKENYIVKV